MSDPDPILGAEETITPAANPNKEILETLNSIKAGFDDLKTKVDDIDARTTPPEDENEEEIEDPNANWKPKTWGEIPQKTVEIANETARESVNQVLEEREAAEQEKRDTEAAQNKQTQDYFAASENKLQTEKFLPEVKDATNDNDPGRVARRELYGYAARVQTINLETAAESLKEFHKQGVHYDPRANGGHGAFVNSERTPFGINSPVGSSSGSSGVSTIKPKYEQIAKGGSLEEIAAAHSNDE